MPATATADTAAEPEALELNVGKLVRDRIPDLIRARGAEPTIRLLDEADYDAALRAKLIEEAQELQAAANPSELLAEAADVYEVLLALGDRIGVDLDAIAEAARHKRAERGAFHDRIWLETC